MQNRPPTIGEYLLRKLENYGVAHNLIRNVAQIS